MFRKYFVILALVALTGCAAPTSTEDSLQKMSPQTLNERAVALWKNGKFSDPNLALKYANLATSKDPDYARAYYTKGFAYYSLGQYELSIENFSKAITLDSQIAEAYNGRGWTYGTIENYEKAIRDFTKAIEIDPNYKLAYNNRAMAYLEIKQNEKACMDLERVCQLGDCGNIQHARDIGTCK